jgi:YD repeat-containing protein
MPITITERPLYNLISLETSAWTTPFTWVDRINDVVGSIAYSQGGRLGQPGESQTEVGTLNATFKDLASPPAVGDLIRLRRAGTTEYAFVGYVQDVSQQVVFDRTASLATPVVLTSVNCLDWVGYISQFDAIGVGGLAATTFAEQTIYPYQSRARALNNIIDATNATQLIAFDSTSASSIIGDTDAVGTFSDHLDLAATSQNLFWHSNNVLPTNKTTGRTGLVTIRPLNTAPSSGKTFTDEVGTAGQLHYVEIDLSSSSQNIANQIILENHCVRSNPGDVSKLGGGNESYFRIINNLPVPAFDVDHVYSDSDATSITTYGNRASTFSTNVLGSSTGVFNYVGNPSFEYGEDGWSGSLQKIVRRQPAENSTPFAAVNGTWALRMRLASTSTSPEIRYDGTEIDGMPVRAGTFYGFKISGARGSPNRTDVRGRAFIRYFDENDGVVGTSFGSQTVFGSTAYVWQAMSLTAIAPGGAVRAVVGIEWNRSGGGQFSAGDQFWCDSALFRGATTVGVLDYFDGDTTTDATNIHSWMGQRGLSPSAKFSNQLDTLATTYLTRYSTTSNRVTRLRWNAQEDLTAVSTLKVGSTISVRFDGTTTTYRIVGVDGNIAAERYMIDYYLEKV